MPDPERVPAWTLGWRLQRSLAHAGITVNDIADSLEVNRATVSRWLNDRIVPRQIYVKEWALICGVPYYWLASGEEAGERESNPGEAYRQVRRSKRRHQSPPCCKPRHLTLVVA